MSTGENLKHSLGLDSFNFVRINRAIAGSKKIYFVYYDSRRPNFPITNYRVREWPFVSEIFDGFNLEKGKPSKITHTPLMDIRDFKGSLQGALVVAVDLAGSFQINIENMQPVAESIKEKSFNKTDIPKYFYLVTSYPDDLTLDSLKKGKIEGLTGISGSNLIIPSFMGVARNTILQLDGNETAKLNNLSRIMYDNPHYLVSNGLYPLARLWLKVWDGKIKYGGVFQNLFDNMKRICKQSHPDLYHEWDYRGVPDYEVDKFIKAGNKIDWVQNVSDLTKFLQIFITNGPEDFKGKEALQDMSFKDLYTLIWDTLKFIGDIYSDEGEWVIKNKTLILPKDYEVYLGISTVAYRYIKKEIDEDEFQRVLFFNSNIRERQVDPAIELESFLKSKGKFLNYLDMESFRKAQGEILDARTRPERVVALLKKYPNFESVDPQPIRIQGKLKEFVTLYDLADKGNVSDFTLVWRNDRNRTMGQENRTAKLIDCFIDEADKSVTFAFLTEATELNGHEPNEDIDSDYREYPLPKGEADPEQNFSVKVNRSKTYEMQIKILDVLGEEGWISTFNGETIGNREMKEILEVSNVQIYSTSPSFHWQGANYNCSQLDASIYPTNIGNPVWGPRHGNSSGYFLDKHLYGLLRSIKFWINPMAAMLTRKLRERNLI
jgi:hypothetical protein